MFLISSGPIQKERGSIGTISFPFLLFTVVMNPCHMYFVFETEIILLHEKKSSDFLLTATLKMRRRGIRRRRLKYIDII